MSGNYTEETKPLFKLLRTEAFRFVLVHFNHYSLSQQLKEDLLQRFPERAVIEIDAKQITYREIVDSYYELGKGIFLINNFEGVLTDPEKYIGLNLRRDKLAKYPIAMICFVSPGAQELSARDIMEKMPDLWSFRSLLLDLKVDMPIAEKFSGSKSEVFTNYTKMSSLGGYNSSDKLQELERFEKLVAETVPEEKALLQTLYQQIKDIQKDLGFYTQALETLSIVKSYANDSEDLALLYIEEGDLLNTTGKYSDAFNAFNTAMTLLSPQPEENKNNIAVINERLGSLYMDTGDIEEAFTFYTKYNDIEKELYEAYPQNVDLKDRLAISYARLGETHASLGNLDKAVQYYNQFNDLEKELYESYPQNVDFKNNLAISYSKLGEIQTSLGNLDKALQYYEQFNDLGKELYEAYPQNVDFKNNLATSYSKLGETQAFLGNFEKALQYYEQYNLLEKELFEAYSQNVNFKNRLAISYSKLGEIHTSLSNLYKALEYYEQYNYFKKQLYEAYPQNVSFKNGLAISYSKLGEIQTSLGNLDKALQYYEQFNYLEKELCEDYPQNVEFKNNLAISYSQLGRFYKNEIEETEKTKNLFLTAEILWKELVSKFPDYAQFKKNLNWVENVLKDL